MGGPKRCPENNDDDDDDDNHRMTHMHRRWANAEDYEYCPHCTDDTTEATEVAGPVQAHTAAEGKAHWSPGLWRLRPLMATVKVGDVVWRWGTQRAAAGRPAWEALGGQA